MDKTHSPPNFKIGDYIASKAGNYDKAIYQLQKIEDVLFFKFFKFREKSDLNLPAHKAKKVIMKITKEEATQYYTSLTKKELIEEKIITPSIDFILEDTWYNIKKEITSQE